MITFSDTTKSCLICSSSVKINLECNCNICEDCLFQWIATKNFEILFSPHQIISCPNHSCRQNIPMDWLQNNLSKKNLNCINEILFRKYTNTDQNYRQCPNQTCSYIGWVDTTSKCKDALECAICKHIWDDPSLMYYEFFYKIYLIITNLKEYISSDLTELNILLTSKPCGHCGIKIYKYIGCDHVTCSSCKKGFCYNCCSDHSSTDNLAKTYCNYKYFFSIASFFLMTLACVVKFFSSFYYIRTFCYYILYFIGFNIIAGGYLIIIGALVYWILYDVFNRYDYYNNPPTYAKIILFILLMVILFLHFCLYRNYESVSSFTNWMLVEAVALIVLTGLFIGAYIINKKHFKIKFKTNLFLDDLVEFLGLQGH